MYMKIIVWQCPNCEGKPEFNQPAFLEHLREFHQVKDTRGSYQTTMHMCGRGFSSCTRKWIIGGLEFLQSVTTEKIKGSSTTSP